MLIAVIHLDSNSRWGSPFAQRRRSPDLWDITSPGRSDADRIVVFDMAAPVETWVPTEKLFQCDVSKVFQDKVLDDDVVVVRADNGHLARSREAQLQLPIPLQPMVESLRRFARVGTSIPHVVAAGVPFVEASGRYRESESPLRLEEDLAGIWKDSRRRAVLKRGSAVWLRFSNVGLAVSKECQLSQVQSLVVME
jgi:hypothetical protein